MKPLSFRSKILYTFLIVSLLTSACVNLNPPTHKIDNPAPISNTIPKDFDWKTIKELSCTVNVSAVSGIADNMIRVIKIFNNSQLNDGALIANGAATPASPFLVKISLATSVPTIYVQEILPDGTTNLQTINILGTTLQVNFASSMSAGVQMNTNTILIAANAPIIDNDGDGVGSTLDVDDNDVSVAFASYFPSAGTWGTYVFEDMWPVKGDYDLNDLVLGFKVSYYTNSTNQVTKFRLDYNMRAAGSRYSLGAAFQLDNVEASNIQSVTGQAINGTSPYTVGPNGTESGVSQAVIPLFNNQQDVVTYSNFLNTVSGSYIVTPDQYVSLRFNTPLPQSDVAMSAFNMFIVANKRECEVHLPTYAGTTKFDPSIANGYTLYPGDKFKNSDGMMWGILIPEPFEYPSERNSIISAYTYFSDWATSGGATHTDWYRPGAGNARQDQIYQVLSSGENTVTDIEGNVYPIVTIGTQIWMAENLQTTKYNDGISIPNVSDNTIWSALTSGAYCWYNNDYANNGAIYGALYNWYAVSSGKLCPQGWHIPTDIEWYAFDKYLVLNGFNYDGTTISNGDKAAKSLASKTLWTLSSNIGAVGNSDFPSYRNKTGFTALPAGYRASNGAYLIQGDFASWWSTSLNYDAPEFTSHWMLYYDNYFLWHNGVNSKTIGYSSRCLKGVPQIAVLSTLIVTEVTGTSAKSGGIVLSDGGAPIIDFGLCWSTDTNPTTNDNLAKIEEGYVYNYLSENYIINLSGLTPGTTYYARAYATNNVGTAYGNIVSFTTKESVIDIEGNVYPIVTIGTQTWMTENLKTTKYRNGNSIGTTIPASLDIQAEISPKYQWAYASSESNVATYGRLYTWYAATDSRNICPTGWHVPTDTEWTTLTTFLGGESVAAGKLKETGTSHWLSPNTGATNSSGFTALPGGFRINYFGTFYNIGKYGGWWSSTEYSTVNARLRSMLNDASSVGRDHLGKLRGLSVRCVKD